MVGVCDSVKVRVHDSEGVEETEVELLDVICGVGVMVKVGVSEWMEVGVREVGVNDPTERVQVLLGVSVLDVVTVGGEPLGLSVQEGGVPVMLREGVWVCVLVRVGVDVCEEDCERGDAECVDEKVPVRLRCETVSVKLDVRVQVNVRVNESEEVGLLRVWLRDAGLGVSDRVWVFETVQVCVGAPVKLGVRVSVRRCVWVRSLCVEVQVRVLVAVCDLVRLKV
mmetsp:Transcript_81836/g.144436  ORF Transcript_81836/g.144436 Transcript_81836/m.144436 type:complete len:224 (+) Transcript_81836:995-1666(+)